MDINFCHRCAAPLTKLADNHFACQNGHQLFYDPSPTAAAVLVMPDGKLALTVRGMEPQKGKNSLFGGFVDYGESLEQALTRELKEEAGLTPQDYETPQYVHSGPEAYSWGGNTKNLLTTTYIVRLKPHAKIVPADDVADVLYVTPQAVPYDNIGFASNVVAIKKVIAVLQNNAH